MQYLYSSIQLLVTASFALSLSIPLAVSLNYLRAFDAKCSPSVEQYFEFYRQRRMFSVYLCCETIATRVWTLMETNKLLAISDGRPLWYWAAFDRLKFLMVAVSVAVVLDVGAIAWAYDAENACSNLTEDQFATLNALCRHTVNVSSGIKALHISNLGLTVALFGLTCIWWWRMTPNEIKDKDV